MTKFVSICLLAYKRPEQLKSCIKSLKENTVYPYELIVNLDGFNNTDEDNVRACDIAYSYYRSGDISKLILVGGKNRGVGTSFKNCADMAEGDYIVKCDTDITFDKGWLTRGVDTLETTNVNAVGFFDYKNYDPNDHRFDQRIDKGGYWEVDDLVSSVYLFRRRDLIKGRYDYDDGFHQNLKPLAILKKDMVRNSGFGVTKSVYVSGTEDHPVKTKTYTEPLVFVKD